MLGALKCLSSEEKSIGEIIMSKMKKRMNTESLHIEYLNQTLKKDCDFILDEDQMAEGEIKIRELKEIHANVGSQKSLRA